MNDARKFPRLDVALKVSYSNEGEFQRDLVTDLSSGGLFVRTSRPLQIGTEVELQIQIGPNEPEMIVRGKVIWLRGKTDRDNGMGIQFIGPLGSVLHDLVQRSGH